MQKKLIALAIAGLAAAPAFAQVTVYGVADAGLTMREVDAPGTANDSEQTGVSSGLLSGSRIGFRATEDLGGGLSANAVIEAGVNLDDGNNGQGQVTSSSTGAATAAGTSTVWGRQSWVGLKGGFGDVRLGRQYSAASAALLGFDTGAGGLYSALANDQLNNGDFNSGGTRENNTVAYISPALGPVTVSATYSFGEQNTANTGAGATTDARTKLSLAATAPVGPLNVGVFYTADAGAVTTTTSGTDVDEMGFGVTGVFGPAKVFFTYALYESDKSNNPGSTTSATNQDGSQYQLGVQFTIGNGTIAAQYVAAENETKSSAAGTGLIKTGENEQSNIAIAYLHSLSKRTTAHIGLIQRTRDAKPVGAASGETKIDAYAVGIRHTF